MRNPMARLSHALVLTAVVAAAAPASAQVFTGRIEVSVVDATGAVMPGVTVEIMGPQRAVFVTGLDGMVRFLNLEPGTYQVAATIADFEAYRNPEVPVVAAGTMALKVSLKLAGMEEQIVVTGESPVIDANKSGTSTSVTVHELQNIPTARDPWVVVQTVPGVVIDRVNVGGNESGQQSTYVAKGASMSDNTWNLDGIPITDMAATGTTSTYYDFDMFQEMNVTTGGSDMGSSTGGVHLNLVLKSATNTWHGSSRLYLESDQMQANNIDPDLATALGSPNGKGNRITRYADYGFELGGPLVRDRLWAWGSLGKTDLGILTVTQTPDQTTLKNAAFKAQAQITPSIRAGFTYFHGNKVKFGRGASATRPPETTHHQTGSSHLYKGEVNLVVGRQLFLTARGSAFPGSFRLDPQGGMDANLWFDDSGAWHGTWSQYASARPQQTVVAEGSYFRGRHELKFGFSWRRVTTESMEVSPGTRVWTYHDGYPHMIAEVWSDLADSARAHYTAAWIGDTITLERLTMNVGARFDRQDDGLEASNVGAVPGFEWWLPARASTERPGVVVFNSVSPRISASFALDQSGKTRVRGSYALFASQLGNGTSYFIAPTGPRYIAFPAIDTDGNYTADLGEIDQTDVLWWGGFDITDPSKGETLNRIGDYRVPKTHEVIVGIDHQLMRDFSVGGAFTWRRMVDFIWAPPIGVTRAAYVQSGTLTGSGLPDGSSYSVPYYALDPALVADIDAAQGAELTRLEGYHQKFWGIEVSATKRLSNQWMARAAFSTNTHREYFDNPETSVIDPTPFPWAPLVDGGLVISGGGKGGVIALLLPKYQFTANGLYQGPAGFDVGFNLVMREGFGRPWFQSLVPTGDYFVSEKSVAIFSNIDENRLPTVTTVDFRVGWNPMTVFGVERVGLNVYLDVFNLLNAGTVLARQNDKRLTGVTGFDQILEIMSPRIARVGLRLTF